MALVTGPKLKRRGSALLFFNHLNLRFIMKYIVYKNGNIENLVAFPHTIDHDRMAEAMEALRFGGPRNWYRRCGAVVAAGFIDGGQCNGHSETLGIKSRGEVETRLLAAQGCT